MADWNVWKQTFERVRLRDEGDDIETDGCRRFDLDTKLPHWEIFWRLHVVPATNRPGDLHFRQYVDAIVANMAITSHGIFCDLVESEEQLIHVRNGDYGARYQHCLQSLKAGGNAMQKFDDLQRKIIEGALSQKLRRQITVWTKNDWTNTWKKRYDKLAAYRNYLTHTNMPQIMVVGQANGEEIAYVPHEDHFEKYQQLAWNEQKKRFQTHSFEWDILKAVCQRMHDLTIDWLNDTYAQVLKSLDSLLTDEDYHDLWGWDTAKYGRQDKRKGTTCPGSQGTGPGAGRSASPAPPAITQGTYTISARSG